MSFCREILTLQFGNYANQVGAHWWNIQESGFSYDGSSQQDINHDVLYREGLNLSRQTTYTPRMLLVDLDGSQKHLPNEGELYGNSIKRSSNAEEGVENPLKKLKDELEWKETDVEIREDPEVAKNEFQSDIDNPEVNHEEKQYDLAQSAETWADFLYARYHPRTVNILKDYKFEADKQALDTFSVGVLLWKTEQFEDEFCDKIRQYVEECDYLQGFQTIFDSFNGFSGMAMQCLEHLSDDYAKASFAVPVFAPKNVLFANADDAMTDSIRIVNSALSFNGLIEHSSLFVPLSTQARVWRQLGVSRELRSLSYQTDNFYQTSAILAAYLDTISLRYRLKNAPASNTLAGLCGDLTNYGRKLCAGAFSMPFPMQHDEDLIDCLDKYEGSLFTALTPNYKLSSDYLIQSLCVRGIPIERLKRPLEQAKLQQRMAAYKCDSVSEMFQLYLQCSNHASMAHVTSIATAMPTRIPFPYEMFDAAVNAEGFQTLTQRASGAKVNNVPTLASLQSSSHIGDMLEVLHREAKRIKIAKFHRFTTAGLEADHYDEILENLLLFKDNYEDNFEL